MKKIVVWMGMWVGISSLSAQVPQELKLLSPDGNHAVEFAQTVKASGAKQVCYQVRFKGNPVIERSQAGLQMDNRVWEMALGVRSLQQPDCWMDNMEVDSVRTEPTVDRTWTPL